MPTAEARVETERPSRYLVQLCKHFSNKGRHLGHRPRGHPGGDAQALREMRAAAKLAQVEWTDTEGHVSLPWGRITLRAASGVLTLRVEAVDEEDLRRLQDLVTGHVERFGRREGLRVSWQRPESGAASSPAAAGAAGIPDGAAVPGRRHLRVLGLVAVVVLVLAVHLGLGRVILAHQEWAGWTVGGVLAVVLVKATVLAGLAIRGSGRGWFGIRRFGTGGFAIRHGRTAKNR